MSKSFNEAKAKAAAQSAQSVNSVKSEVKAPMNVNGNVVVKVDLYHNITLTNTSDVSGFADKNAKGNVILSARSAGQILRNTKDDSAFGHFRPAPESLVDSYGRANHVGVVLHYADGTRETLHTDQIVDFWSKVLNLGVSASDLNLKVQYDIPEIASKLEDAIYNGEIRCVKITLNDPSSAFTYAYKEWQDRRTNQLVTDLVLRPCNAEVGLESDVFETPVNAIGFALKRGDLARRSVAGINVARITKNAARRSGRLDQTNAAVEAANIAESIVIETPSTPVEVRVSVPEVEEVVAAPIVVDEAPVIAPISAERLAEVEAQLEEEGDGNLDDLIADDEVEGSDDAEEVVLDEDAFDALLGGDDEAPVSDPTSSLDGFDAEAFANNFGQNDEDEYIM